MVRPFIRGTLAAVALGACGADVAAPDGSFPSSPIASSRRASDETRTTLASVFVHYTDAAPRDRERLLREGGAEVVYDAAEVRTAALLMPAAAAAALDSRPWIERVDVDTNPPFRIAGDLIPWSLDSTAATAVHARANRGTGVRIGVLDTRIYCKHADLAGRIAGGKDFLDPAAQICPQAWSGLWPIHGTAVAGIAAGSYNGAGIAGMAPEASLYALRVCDDNGRCPAAAVFAALNWASKAGLQVINMSFGSCNEPDQVQSDVRDQLLRLYQAGIVLVAAAGNGSLSPDCTAGGPVAGIARLPGVIAVTHWRQNGTQNPDFQYGEGVDVAGPTNVPTAAPFGVNMTLHEGTSYATPHVAGAAAILLRAGFSGPDLILRRLAETATDRGPAGWDDHWGWGTIHVGRAAVSAPFVASFSGTGPVAVAGELRVVANVINGAPPIAVTWSVSYSDPGIHAAYVVTGGTSIDVSVPAGWYSITVKATPRETVYGRSGLTSTARISVCATDAGGDDPLLARRTGSAIPGSAPPEAGTVTATACS